MSAELDINKLEEIHDGLIESLESLTLNGITSTSLVELAMIYDQIVGTYIGLTNKEDYHNPCEDDNFTQESLDIFIKDMRTAIDYLSNLSAKTLRV